MRLSVRRFEKFDHNYDDNNRDDDGGATEATNNETIFFDLATRLLASWSS